MDSEVGLPMHIEEGLGKEAPDGQARGAEDEREESFTTKMHAACVRVQRGP